MAQRRTQPDPAIRFIASLLVGAAASYVVTKMLGKSAGAVGLIIGFAAHEALDAPVAKALNEAW